MAVSLDRSHPLPTHAACGFTAGSEFCLFEIQIDTSEHEHADTTGRYYIADIASRHYNGPRLLRAALASTRRNHFCCCSIAAVWVWKLLG
jgi:hypothetical protein